MDAKEFLVKLSNAAGVSGYESGRAEIIRGFLAPYCEEITEDGLGSVIGLKKGRGKGKIMFAAHMDEIGLMAAGIDENGFIRLTTLGGFDQRTLLAQEVIIHGKREIHGVIGVKPPHLTTKEEAKKAVKFEDLLVDTGLCADEVRELVSVGDIITINRRVVELKNNKLAGKAFDDVAGVACYAAAMEKLKDFNHDMDVYFTATVQEEVGLGGAETSAYTIEPDIGIAIDVGFAKTPELTDNDTIAEMGGGPEIAIGPNMHRNVVKRLRDVAKANGIKHQVSVTAETGGTDTEAIQVSRGGVATALLSIPLKFMHTSVETISIDDVLATGRLLADFVISLNNQDMEEFLCL